MKTAKETRDWLISKGFKFSKKEDQLGSGYEVTFPTGDKGNSGWVRTGW